VADSQQMEARLQMMNVRQAAEAPSGVSIQSPPFFIFFHRIISKIKFFKFFKRQIIKLSQKMMDFGSIIRIFRGKF
jgi:hypothetical protein